MFLIWSEGRDVSRGWARGVAYVVCPHVSWCCVQGTLALLCFWSQPPIFAPDSSEVVDGVFSTFILCS